MPNAKKYFSKEYWVEWVFLSLIFFITILGFFYSEPLGYSHRISLWALLFAGLAEGKVAKSGVLKYFSLLLVLIALGALFGTVGYLLSPKAKTSEDFALVPLVLVLQAMAWAFGSILGLLLQRTLSFILRKFSLTGKPHVYFALIALCFFLLMLKIPLRKTSNPIVAPLEVSAPAAAPATALPELPQSPEIAEKVAEQFAKMSFPGSSASDFEHWAYDTSAMSANHCWTALNKSNPKPAVLKNFAPTRNGSWTLPRDETLVNACRSFANTGFNPICFRAQVIVKNVKIRPGLPSDYLQVHSKDQTLELEGSLHCYLNADQLETQEYWGQFQAKWIEAPSAKTINLPSGPETLQVGTIMVSAPGVKNTAGNDFEEPHMALVVPAP